jgi:hypothetical protein
MIDLGLVGFEICVRQGAEGFNWYASFFLRHTGVWYSHSGNEPSDEEAFYAAKAWQAGIVREVVR